MRQALLASVCAAQRAFQRGVALLHSYEYDNAHDAFAEARAAISGK
jgi:hypothetical protein